MKISTPFVILQCALTGFLLLGCEGNKTDAAKSQKVQQETEQGNSSESVVETAAVDSKANEIHPGKALHDTNCISCHDSGVYSRDDRKISDFPKLLAQVKRCDANLGSQFFDEEIEQVTDYLNQAYYKYEK